MALPRSSPEGHPYRTISRICSRRYGGSHSKQIVDVQGVRFGGSRPVVIAGPCAVESESQTLEIARCVCECGADMLRGGAFKPRTSPYDFQGLGRAGLEILDLARRETGLPLVTEVMDVRLVEEVAHHADMLQVGSRSMQNFPLLSEVGKMGKPVLLKRAMAATLHEWLCAAEYIAKEGNTRIVLCERGIRSFASGEYTRFSLDLGIIEPLQQLTFLPVIVDPSHASGRAHLVPAAARAALEVGVDGLIVEVIGERTRRADVLCDGPQAIRPQALRCLVEQARVHSRAARVVERL